MDSTTLLIMRHAKSDWNRGDRDFDRVLAERGKEDAARMGGWIVNSGYTPDNVICSPAQRVRETISLAGQAWDQDEAKIRWDESVYNASLNSLLAVVAGNLLPGKINFLTGHNPGVSELLLYLSGDRIPKNADTNMMPTSAIVVFESHNDANFADYGAWNIINYMKPRLLL